MKKIKKIGVGAVIVVGVLGGALFALPYILGFFTSDILPIDDRDLRLEKVILLDANNAYFDLVRAGKALSLTEEEKKIIPDLAAGTQWDATVAASILAKNEQALEHFSLAATKRFQDIHFSDPKDVSPDFTFPYVNDWRALARLSVVRARVLANEGKGVDSFDEAMKSIRMGDSIARGQGTVVHYLVGLGIKRLGMSALLDNINALSLDHEMLRRSIKDFSGFFDNESGLKAAVKIENRNTTNIIDAIVDNTYQGTDDFSEIKKFPKTSYYFRPNKTKQLFAQPARNLFAQIQKPCTEISFPEISRPSGIGLYFTENAIGHIMMSIGITSQEGIFDTKCQDDLLVGVAQTMLALKLYRGDGGTYPALLQELVPQYLPAVPLDPYDGKPLRYDASKKILYSAGKDGRDDGGSEGDDWKKMADPTFSVVF